MKMQRIVILVIALFMGVNLYAQSSVNEQKAFQNFKQAREAYDQENYESAAELLLKTKELLGSTNIRIQPMLIKSLAKIEDWRQAQAEFPAYYALNPDPELVEYQELKNLQNEVNNKVREEEQAYQNARATQAISQYQSYLDSYPYGKYRSEVQNLLQNQNDENAWSTAQTANNTDAYFTYLESYPNGKYAATAKETITSWDVEAYQKAISDGSQQALNFYLDNYPEGKYREEVSKKLAVTKEEDLYQKARNNDYVENYEDYIRQYPDGKYAGEVRQVIENSYFDIAKNAYAGKNYPQARNYYEKYQENYPNGRYSSEVATGLRKTRNQLNQQSIGFVLYTNDSESPIGISTGRLNPHKLGFYWNMKMNSDIFKATSATYKIDDNGTTDRPGDIKLTGETKYANFSISIGMTFKLAYPLYGYMGVGYGYYPVYEEASVYYSSSGDYWEDDWLRNTDQTESAFFPEGGFLLNLGNKLVLKCGLMYHNDIVYQFGFGFKL